MAWQQSPQYGYPPQQYTGANTGLNFPSRNSPINTGYPNFPTNTSYPPSNPTGYPPSISTTTAYPPSNPTGYPPSNPTGYPPSITTTAYPPANTGYPPNYNTSYPPSNPTGYPPSNPTGYPPSNPTGYPPSNYPTTTPTITTTSYPPTNTAVRPPSSQTGYPSNPSPLYPPNTTTGYPPSNSSSPAYPPRAASPQPTPVIGYLPTTNTNYPPMNPSPLYPPNTTTGYPPSHSSPAYPPRATSAQPTYSQPFVPEPVPTRPSSAPYPNPTSTPQSFVTPIQTTFNPTITPSTTTNFNPAQTATPFGPTPTSVPSNQPPSTGYPINPYATTVMPPTTTYPASNPFAATTQPPYTGTTVEPQPMTRQPTGPMNQLQRMLHEKQLAEYDAMRGVTDPNADSNSGNSAYRQSVMIAVNQQQEMLEKRKQAELAKQNTVKLASESLDKRMQELEKLKVQRQLARDQKQKEDSEIESRLQLEKLEQERVKNATQSFYSVILEHFRSVASNTHNVYSYFRESFDDLMDASSIASELLNERLRFLTSTISLIEEELKNNLQFINGSVYESMSNKTKALNQSLAPLIEYCKFIAASENHSQLRQEKIEEREAKHKKMFLSIFLAVKELIAELETQKLSSDSIKEVLETTSHDIHFLQSEVVIVAPRPKLERIPVVDPKPFSSYNPKDVELLQATFKKLSGPATIRNLVAEYKASQSSKKGKTRINVLFEFMSTEETYVTAMKKAVTYWLRPLQAEVKKKTPIIIEQDINTIFSSLETIIQINETLLAKIQQRLSKFPSETKFGDIFIGHAQTLKLYVEYVNKFDQSMNTYSELNKNNLRFAEFLNTAKATAQSNLDLASILIMPVQRIPRYELLLRELIKCTNEMHTDWSNLQKAQKEIQSINLYINAQKLKQDTNRKLLLAEEKIVSNIPLALVAPHRLYIHDGKVEFLHQMKKVSGHLYLMNDIAIITKYSVTTPITHNYVNMFNLHIVTYREVGDDNFSLLIKTEDKMELYDFWCQPNELAKWTKEFNEAINTCSLKKILDIPVESKKDFVILDAKYGVLKKLNECKDVTEEIINIMKMQGGDQLLLKAEAKSIIFGNPSPKSKKELQITAQVKGKIKVRTFQDTQAVDVNAATF